MVKSRSWMPKEWGCFKLDSLPVTYPDNTWVGRMFWVLLSELDFLLLGKARTEKSRWCHQTKPWLNYTFMEILLITWHWHYILKVNVHCQTQKIFITGDTHTIIKHTLLRSTKLLITQRELEVLVKFTSILETFNSEKTYHQPLRQ